MSNIKKEENKIPNIKMMAGNSEYTDSLPCLFGIPLTLKEVKMVCNALKFFESESYPPRHGGDEAELEEWEELLIKFNQVSRIK